MRRPYRSRGLKLSAKKKSPATAGLSLSRVAYGQTYGPTMKPASPSLKLEGVSFFAAHITSSADVPHNFGPAIPGLVV